MMNLEGKRILVTGGTGSLGQTLVGRILTGEMGRPEQVTVFSRDEAKQHYMRLEFLHRKTATDDIIYQNSQDLLLKSSASSLASACKMCSVET